MDDPTALLVAPGEPDASVSNGFANPLDLFNYVSPSAWMRPGSPAKPSSHGSIASRAWGRSGDVDAWSR